MKKPIIFFCLCFPLFCMAQDPLPPNTLPRQYEYDLAGNRTSRKVLEMAPPLLVPPAPQDSTFVTHDNNDSSDPLPQTSHSSPLTSHSSLLTSDFYVENIAQTEIKIYPNPTTEKVTLEISGWETLQKGVFKLFTMNGQLLQERPVHSIATEVSLAGLAKGAYILKVQINDRTEDWKIIKN